jgi:hypothetical protein
MTVSLPPLPRRIQRLPRDRRGFPIPWFVATIDGEPDFRVIGRGKLADAVRQKRCWVCGEPLGRKLAFVIGPMCAITRVISEPPSHRDCALFSAHACPFLTQPRMRRNEKDLPENRVEPAGYGLSRNPGACCVWITHEYHTVRAHRGNDGILFQLGEPTEVLWFCNGRQATREEIAASMESGLKLLPPGEGPAEWEMARVAPLLDGLPS